MVLKKDFCSKTGPQKSQEGNLSALFLVLIRVGCATPILSRALLRGFIIGGTHEPSRAESDARVLELCGGQ